MGSRKDGGMSRSHRLVRFRQFLVPFGVLACAILISPSPAPSRMSGPPADPQDTERHSQRIPGPTTGPETSPNPGLTSKQKQALIKSNFEKTKDDAAELAEMASGLRDELNKTSVDVLSVDVIHRAEKIEKLARKIKEEAKGY